MRILMVHGRSQGGRKVAELETIWRETLQEGFANARKDWPAKVSIDFPFYGDTLDELVAQASLPTPADVVAKGPGQNTRFEEFMESALNEMKARASIEDEAVRVNQEPGPPTEEKGIQNWRWIQAIARTIDERVTRTSSFAIEKLLRDVFLYVTRPAVTRQVDALVEARLTAEPTIVIAHSLGSVVAYNIVRRRKDLDLRRFITVGSPLGLRAISSKLGIPENPAAAAGWYNAYDKRDIVALNPLDDAHFPVEPAIVNSDSVDNSADNRHGIIGYLDDKGVAAQVAEALA
ncbi:MAG: hypothetical protein ABIQ06_13970 [Caldimonas sp.]